ncbi:hypothetical protein SAY87_019815 [Trapa incisa]|uniref:La-related protein 6C n=1 Tax=Trapa incisa TaxID=236973 RepID=A0AAN7K2V7_9MYRT|nr:hypothetical protein SAY87_019815 [Trapa incisa]
MQRSMWPAAQPVTAEFIPLEGWKCQGEREGDEEDELTTQPMDTEKHTTSQAAKIDYHIINTSQRRNTGQLHHPARPNYLPIHPSTSRRRRRRRRRNAAYYYYINVTSSALSSQSHLPDLSAYYYPCFQFFDSGASGSDWLFVGDLDPGLLISGGASDVPANCSRNVLGNDLQQKIVKQVEYILSDMSLLANDSLTKQMNKDPEGYIPLPVIASMKKVKSLTSSTHLLAQALQSSSKLVVSSDGKRVKRKHPFTEKDREDLQYRTVVVENLPEDHSHQNLEKIFSVVGSVKNIRICHPQESTSSRSRCDFFIANKLHALIEYVNMDTAELAAEKLNDERNWRKGLRVRLLVKRSPKSVLKSRRSEFDCILDDEDSLDSTDDFHPSDPDVAHDSNAEDSLKKGWGARGRGKTRGRPTSHIGRGALTLQPNSLIQCEPHPKLMVKCPRMPDGTRGFAMGRGKPLPSSSSPSSPK